VTRGPLSLTRLIGATLAYSTPALAGLALLLALDRISLGTLVLGFAVSVLFMGWLVRRSLADLAAVEGYVDDLGRGSEEAPPPVGAAAAGIAAAAGRLGTSIAERTRRLEARSEAKATVLDYVPEPVVLIDRSHQVIGANLAARNLFGRSAIGRSLASLLRDPAVLDAAAGALADGGARDVEFTLPTPVERVLCARIKTLPEALPDGTAAIIALQDLTMVKRIDSMRADFVANVSHELRTPLAALIGFIETLRGPANEDAAARERFLEIMHDQSQRMARLVDDLMSLSRIEMHEHTVPTTRVDVAQLVQYVAETLQIKAGKKGMTFKLDLPEDPPLVLGEPDELTRVFQNLMDNAIKYGRARSAIEIRIRHEPAPMPGAQAARDAAARDVTTHEGEGAVAVAVTDHGDGIPPEHLPRLTERFYRVDKARSRELGGTGLGLAIVKHIVNHHRGALNVASTLGKGSTFTVRLPSPPSP
jgi:two-component system, OmpR family, phosphate regulon sensor histidine kinase PhoR